MTKLSRKATRFIEAAVAEMEDQEIRAIWTSAKHDTNTELPEAVARTALSALSYLESQLMARLERPLTEDEASDLSNDLGFVRAIESDLRRQLFSPHADSLPQHGGRAEPPI
jgi:hypothetical protein